MPTELDNAYAAGIIDGEGSIMLSKTQKLRKFRFPNVSVANTDMNILNFLKNTYGGIITKKTKTKSHHLQSYTWFIRSDSVFEFLKMVTPYLKQESKVYRAHLILDEYKSITKRNGYYSEDEINKKYLFQARFFDKDITSIQEAKEKGARI